ncbi:outer membrane protein assembly factor BamB family protein [Nigerium massiliense]|uniref:outer membrane protein assembly factor BamB family protein n=1 Tax=Nigerium massiliense TaxID=1522317 RepID=UPI00058D57A4|nr:PQQ-binding-like beta-propeller repeat protein [Nigerium massiliense]
MANPAGARPKEPESEGLGNAHGDGPRPGFARGTNPPGAAGPSAAVPPIAPPPAASGRPPRRRRRRPSPKLIALVLAVLLVALALVAALIVVKPWDRPAPGSQPALPDLPAAPKAAWTAEIGEGVVPQAVLDPGRDDPARKDRLLLDTLAGDGRLTALNTADGTVAWRSPQLYDARCVLGHAGIVACLADTTVHLFDLRDGHPTGTFEVAGTVADLAGTPDGLLVLDYDSAKASPIALRQYSWTGVQGWTREIAPGGDYLGTPEGPRLHVDGDRAVVTAQGAAGADDARGQVVRVSDGVPVTDKPGAYGFAGNGLIARLTPEQTTELLSRDGRPQGVLPGTLIDLTGDAAPADRPLFVLGEQGVSRVDQRGTVLWTSTDVSLPGVVCGDTVLEGMDGHITALDFATGVRRWQESTTMSDSALTCNGTRVIASPGPGGQDVGGKPGAAAFDLASGHRLWQVDGLAAVFPTTAGLLSADPGLVTLYR